MAGVAHVAALPPFEGFDEVAHWSYIQQIADEGHIPVYGEDRLSADVARYPGPRATDQGQPYRIWFAAPHPGRAVAESGPTHFSQGEGLNWQAQHPPLYYLLMVPLYRLGAHLDWPEHLLLLRLGSWGLAFAGFAWGARRTQTVLSDSDITDARLLLPASWPFLFPQFFPEMARLTNDTLCLLLLAAVWSLILGLLECGYGTSKAIALGATLGAGLLTKAFFLPVTAGVGILLGIAAWRRRDRAAVVRLLVTLVLAGAVGGVWYVYKWLTTGTLTGGADFVALQRAGGLWHGLVEHFSPTQYVLGLIRILIGFAWAGTWSFAHPNHLAVAPIIASVVLAGVFYAIRLRRSDLIAWAPASLVVPMLGGLLYHLLNMVAMTGLGAGTPGWYLHIFAAPLSFALALGWRWPRLQGALAAYGVAFGAAMVPWQLSFFSGCLARDGAGTATLAGATCGIDIGHLEAITLPGVALAAGAIGLMTLAAAAVLLVRTLQRGEQSG